MHYKKTRVDTETGRYKDRGGNEKQRKTKIVFNLLKISLPFEILRILVFHMAIPHENYTYFHFPLHKLAVLLKCKSGTRLSTLRSVC